MERTLLDHRIELITTVGIITFIENDGHQTIYTLDEQKNCYVAPAHAKGTPYFSFDVEQRYWIRYEPQTQIKEYYTTVGLLEKRVDAAGIATYFTYDTNKQLESVTGPSGETYYMKRQETSLGWNFAIQNSQRQTQWLYQFDNQGRLRASKTPDLAYETKYDYKNHNAILLDKITQTDNTELRFAYDPSCRVNRLSVGTDPETEIHVVDYQKQSVINGAEIGLHYELDTNKRFVWVGRECGIDQADSVLNSNDLEGLNSNVELRLEKTNYTYTSKGQLKSIIRPNGSVEQFTYDANYADLLKQHIGPNGKISDFVYSLPDNQKLPQLDVKNETLITNQTTKQLQVHYIYEFPADNLRYLRFEINATGLVTEYRYLVDEKGQIKENASLHPTSVRTYLKSRYAGDLDNLELDDLVRWAKDHKSEVSLVEFDYDNRGQVSCERHYAVLNQRGGKVSKEPSMQEIQTQWNTCGNWECKTIRRSYNVHTDVATTVTSKQAFDNLQRLIEKTDPLNQTTSYEFKDSESKIIRLLPYNSKNKQSHGQIETQQYNSRGVVATVTRQVRIGSDTKLQTRATQREYDVAGRVVATIRPDKQTVYSLYDRQNRLAFTISASGIVTEHRYVTEQCFQHVITYAKPIVISEWLNKSQVDKKQFSASVLENLLDEKDIKNQEYYNFYDASQQVRYHIEANYITNEIGEKSKIYYLTENCYDSLNRKTSKIQYAEVLTETELTQLKRQGILQKKPNVEIDRCWKTVYDDDNNKIGEQDPAGYVTEYKRNAAGWITEKTTYRNASNVDINTKNIKGIRPEATKADGHHHYFYDKNGLVLREVNPVRVLFAHTYNARGLKEKTIQYANPMNNGWQNNMNSDYPTLPVVNKNDRKTTFVYDTNGRLTQKATEKGLIEVTTYNVFDQETNSQRRDLNALQSLDTDHVRGTQTYYDNWGQESAYANVHVNAKLIQQKESSYQRYKYDESGLKLSTIDPEGNITRYYYDNDRRLVLALMTQNKFFGERKYRAIENTLNVFGKVECERQYANDFPYSEDIPLMDDMLDPQPKGGFITPKIKAVLEKLKSSQDRLTYYTYDNQNRVIKKIDPAEYVSTYEYNRFGEVIEENLPLNENDKEEPGIRVNYERDVRGLATETTRQPTNFTAQTPSHKTELFTQKVIRKFDNQFGLENYRYEIQRTDKTQKVEYKTSYDQLGRQRAILFKSSEMNDYEYRDVRSYDVFSRLTAQVDAEHHMTTYEYNDVLRTCTKYSPLVTAWNESRAQVKPPIQFTRRFSNIEMKNVFGETIQMKNGLNEKTNWTHAPDGQIQQKVNAVGDITKYDYNNLGKRMRATESNGLVTEFEYNGHGQLSVLTKDVGPRPTHSNLKTVYEYNVFGDIRAEQAPDCVWTHHEVDKRGLLVENIFDPQQRRPAGLNLITRKTYNGQRKKTSEQYSNLKESDQFTTHFVYDALGRSSDKIVDPISQKNHNGLNIRTKTRFNKVDLITRKTDANGNTLHIVYDDFKRKSFEINAMGCVNEWCYDANDNVTEKRLYTNFIDLSQISDLDTKDLDLITVFSKVKKNSDDTVTHFIYDSENKERFQINGIGEIHEISYDQAGRAISFTDYNTLLSQQQIAELKTKSIPAVNQLIMLMRELSDQKHDRTYHRIFDAVGQIRFKISASGVIREYEFKHGKVIRETVYANQINDPTQVINQNVDNILPWLMQQADYDGTKNQTTYKHYDQQNRLQFLVDPESGVVRYDHNYKGKITQICEFKQVIQVADDYTTRQQQLENLVPDTTKEDRITVQKYDTANRLIKIIDPEGYVEEFTEFDSLGNVKVHKDVMNQTWRYKYDRANRLELELMPFMTITEVNKGTKIRGGSVEAELTFTERQAAVPCRKHYYDSAGNTIKISTGEWLSNSETVSQARTLQSHYNPCNKLTGTEIENVELDDPNKSTNFSNRSTSLQTVTTAIIYNAKKMPVAKRNEAGHWSYYLYDPQNKPIYEIKPDGSVKKTTYNNFGEKEIVVSYSVQLSLTFLRSQIPTVEMINTGFSLGIALDGLKTELDRVIDIAKNDTDLDKNSDREVRYERDKEGRVIAKKEGSVVYYAIESTGAHNAINFNDHKGTASKETRFDYDSFGNLRCEKVLIYADSLLDPNSWSATYHWYSRNNKKIATVEPEGKTTLMQRDRFGDLVEKTQFAKLINKTIDLKTTFQTLEKLPSSSKDRKQCYKHDKRGLLIKEVWIDVVLPKLEVIDGKPQHTGYLVPQNIIRTYHYNGLKQKTAVSKQHKIDNENPVMAYRFFNSHGKPYADVSVPRDSIIAQREKPLIPVTSYGFNIYGQQVRVTRHAIGVSPVVLGKAPVLTLSDDDQVELDYRGSTRGDVLFHQNASGNTTGYTYTASKKVVRHYWLLTTMEKNTSTEERTESENTAPSNRIRVTHLDEEQFTYNTMQKPILLKRLRDDDPVEQTASRYNVFSEPCQEDPGNDNTWATFRRYDSLGRVWCTNAESGITTLIFYDLRNKETCRLQSDKHDLLLDNSPYAQTLGFIDQDNQHQAGLLSWRFERDLAGRKLTDIKPAYLDIKEQAEEIPLSVQISYTFIPGHTVMIWRKPQTQFSEMKLTKMTPAENSDTLDVSHTVIEIKDETYYIDVSHFKSDVYDYTIEYYVIDPIKEITNFDEPVFITKGRIQFNTDSYDDSSNSKQGKSKWLVAEVVNNCEVILSGNVKGLTGIELWQNNQKVAGPLNITAIEDVSDEYCINLKDYDSGVYYIKPIGTTEDSLNLLPITIYTAHMPSNSKDILTKQITLENLNLQIAKVIGYKYNDVWHTRVGSRGQLGWQLPEEFSNKPLRVTCGYLSTESKHEVEIFEVKFNENTDYVTSNYNNFAPNMNFTKHVQSVDWIKIDLFVPSSSQLDITTDIEANIDDDKQWLNILEQTTPNQQLNSREQSNCQENPESSSNRLSRRHTADISKLFDNCFNDQKLLFVYPFDNLTNLPTIQYQDVNSGRVVTWKIWPAKSFVASGFILDLQIQQLPDGLYPARFLGKMFTLPITDGQSSYTSTRSLSNKQRRDEEYVWIRPTTQFAYDVWNNITLEIDPDGHETESEYNYNNNLIKQTAPPVDVVLDDGSRQTHRPVTHDLYDEAGQLIAAIDPNDGVELFILDNAGQQLKHILPDGTVTRTNDYDIFNCLVKYWGPHGEQELWQRTHDKSNNVTSLTKPSGHEEIFAYTEKQQRLSQTNAGNTIYYSRSIKGDIFCRVMPGGGKVLLKYDQHHQLLQKTDPEGNIEQWVRDKHGHLVSAPATSYIGKANVSYQSEFNARHQLIKRTSEDPAGRHHKTLQISEGQIGGLTYYNTSEKATPKQELEYIRNKAGRVIQIKDLANGLIIDYKHNRSGIVVHMTLRRDDGSLLREINTHLDAMHRPSWFFDTYLLLVIGYDKNGNRRVLSNKLFDPEDPTKLKTHGHRENLFDSADRVICVTDDTEKVEREYTSGYLTKQRISQLNQSSEVEETSLEYNADGLLNKTCTSDNQTTERTFTESEKLATFNDSKKSLLREITYTTKDELQDTDKQTTATRLINTSYSNYNKLGEAKNQLTEYKNKNNTKLGNDQLLRTYVNFGNQRILVETSGSRGYSNGLHSGNYAAKRFVNSNGQVIAQTGSETINSGAGTLYQLVGPNNRIWMKVYFATRTIGGQSRPFEYKRIYYFYDLNGQPLGSYEVTPNFSKASEILTRLNYEYLSVHVHGMSQLFRGVIARNSFYGDLSDYRTAFMRGTFELSRQLPLINSSYPPPAPREQIVKAEGGDTWESLAKAAYGDKSYATAVALENVMSEGSQPPTGISIKLPNFIGQHNNFETSTPAEHFIRSLEEGLYPHIVAPVVQSPPRRHHHKHHHGFFSGHLGRLLTVFVGVVAVMLAPALAPFIAELLSVSGAFGTILSTALAGAMLDAAKQGLFEAAGLQEHFSWASVVTAGVTAGAGAWAKTVKFGFEAGELTEKMIAQQVVKQGLLNVTEQLTAMSLHEGAGNFKIESLLVAVGSVGINAGASDFVEDKTLSRLGSEIADDVTSQLIETGHVSIENVAIDVLGIELGRVAASSASSYLPKVNQPTSTQPSTSNSHSNVASKHEQQQIPQNEEDPAWVTGVMNGANGGWYVSSEEQLESIYNEDLSDTKNLNTYGGSQRDSFYSASNKFHKSIFSQSKISNLPQKSSSYNYIYNWSNSENNANVYNYNSANIQWSTMSNVNVGLTGSQFVRNTGIGALGTGLSHFTEEVVLPGFEKEVGFFFTKNFAKLHIGGPGVVLNLMANVTDAQQEGNKHYFQDGILNTMTGIAIDAGAIKSMAFVLPKLGAISAAWMVFGAETISSFAKWAEPIQQNIVRQSFTQMKNDITKPYNINGYMHAAEHDGLLQKLAVPAEKIELFKKGVVNNYHRFFNKNKSLQKRQKEIDDSNDYYENRAKNGF